MAAAIQIDGNNPVLLGIPLAIKDNYYTAGVLTTANSYIFETFVPTFDATAVARLKAAGAIILLGRHTDGRLDHRTVERPGPHRSQAHDGPRLALRDHSAHVYA
jgi:hypothetical protein